MTYRKLQAKGGAGMNHWKKMIAPIVVALVITLYYIGIAVFFVKIPGIPTLIKVLMVVIPLALAVVMTGVLISRIKEIKGGEEDDLSQY